MSNKDVPLNSDQYSPGTPVREIRGAALHSVPSAPFVRAMERLKQTYADIPGVILAVNAPRFDLEFEGAVGVLDHDGDEPLSPNDAFSIASVTKVFISAATFRAIEDGFFGLHDSIGPLLSEETRAVLAKGGYDLDAISVFHLLTHTSGIFDFANNKNWSATLRADPTHEWTRLEQIQFAMAHGQKAFEPGSEYSYSDSGYSLLSEILERATNLPYWAAVATLVDYEKFGLKHTHFEKVQDAPSGERRATQYVGKVKTSSFDPSRDLYGGGGIVSTAGDLVKFIRPLLQGHVFTNPTTLPASLLIPAVGNVRVREHAALLYTHKYGKRVSWAHAGYWMVELLYCPDIDLALAVTTNQNNFSADLDVPASAKILQAAIGDAIDELVGASVAKKLPGTNA